MSDILKNPKNGERLCPFKSGEVAGDRICDRDRCELWHELPAEDEQGRPTIVKGCGYNIQLHGMYELLRRLDGIFATTVEQRNQWEPVVKALNSAAQNVGHPSLPER